MPSNINTNDSIQFLKAVYDPNFFLPPEDLFLDAYYTDILVQAYIFFIANSYSDCVGIHFDRSVLMPHVRSKILNIIPD